MNILASEAMRREYEMAVWPEFQGQPQPTEWAQFWPDSPWFAIPQRGPRPWPFPMLVEFGDADHG